LPGELGSTTENTAGRAIARVLDLDGYAGTLGVGSEGHTFIGRSSVLWEILLIRHGGIVPLIHL
jgi:hypothetical protein